MFRGRLRKALHPTVIEHITKPYLLSAQREVRYHLYIHKAHSVMLKERGLLEPREAREILGGILRLEGDDFYRGELDLGTDLYMNVETRLIGMVGDAAGKMHIGRSRNDLYATSLRMVVREQVLATLGDLLEFITVILQVAGNHVETLMPGYTHWQHAQPVTLAHYLTGMSQALMRDAGRLAAAYARLNRCPLGAGALAGTGFPIDRHRVSVLLGFDDILENSYDAVASRDFVVETAAGLAILMTNLSRLAEDLVIWNTSEFAVVDMPEEFSATSSIMPQKKNPIVLEHIKGRTAHVIAAVTSACTVLKGTSFSHSREIGGETASGLHQAFALTQGALEMLAALLPAVRFDTGLLEQRARDGLSTVTDLADLLVRERQLSFRQAHHVVGAVVNELLDTGQRSDQVDTAMLDRAARDVLGRELGIPDVDIRGVLDAGYSVQARTLPGGPSPNAMKRLIDRQGGELRQTGDWLEHARRGLDEARRRCEEAVRDILDAPPPGVRS